MNSSNSTGSSRFAKYDAGDLPQLLRLQIGENFVAKLTGEHEFEGDNGPLPVLELQLEDDTEAAWMCGTWHGLQQLAAADPQPGDAIRVERLPDQGKSHRYRIEVLGDGGAAAAGGGQGTPSEEIPFAPSVI